MFIWLTNKALPYPVSIRNVSKEVLLTDVNIMERYHLR